jgi:hypothetical protein
LIEPIRFSIPPFEVNRDWEFYDLAADPLELSNLFDKNAAPDLKAVIADANVARDALAGRKSGESHLSEDAKEKLRSLGYLQ